MINYYFHLLFHHSIYLFNQYKLQLNIRESKLAKTYVSTQVTLYYKIF